MWCETEKLRGTCNGLLPGENLYMATTLTHTHSPQELWGPCGGVWTIWLHVHSCDQTRNSQRVMNPCNACHLPHLWSVIPLNEGSENAHKCVVLYLPDLLRLFCSFLTRMTLDFFTNHTSSQGCGPAVQCCEETPETHWRQNDGSWRVGEKAGQATLLGHQERLYRCSAWGGSWRCSCITKADGECTAPSRDSRRNSPKEC